MKVILDTDKKTIKESNRARRINMRHNGKITAIVVWIVILCLLLCACSSGYKDYTDYSLHNRDGSLNQKFINNMNDYFEKHPEKRP